MSLTLAIITQRFQWRMLPISDRFSSIWGGDLALRLSNGAFIKVDVAVLGEEIEPNGSQEFLS